MANEYVKFMRGTTAAYNNLKTKDANTLYFLSDKDDEEGALYLGTKLIAGPDDCSGIHSLRDLSDVLISQNINYDAILMYDSNGGKWQDYSIDALIFSPGTDNTNGTAGFVPAPQQADTNKFLRGDGVWASIGSSNIQIFDAIYLAENQSHEDALAAATADFIVNNGDIAIVKELIAPDRYQYTSYVYNGNKWCAMDGNYNAENVYFSKDFIFTEPVGTVDIGTSGSAQVAAAGKNVKQFFETLFAKEKNPEIIQPDLIITAEKNITYEVGTLVSPTYQGSYDEGKYEFDSTTGVTVSNWKATDSRGEEILSQEGTFEEITVEDNTSYIITLTGTFSNGIIPHTNLGNEYVEGQIKGFSDGATSASLTGYRKTFWGAVDNKNNELNSDFIRTLSSSSSAYNNGKSWTINIPIGTQRVVIAYPSTLRNLTSVLDENDSNANIVSGFGEAKIVQVKGANDYEGIDYKVYVLDFANPYDTNNKFKVTI